MAKDFGSALKAAKHLASVQPRFVEALHPRWNRWRCACILVEKNDMDDYSGVTKRVDSSGVGGNGSAAIEWPWSSFLVGTSLRPATAAEAQELLQLKDSDDNRVGGRGAMGGSACARRRFGKL